MNTFNFNSNPFESKSSIELDKLKNDLFKLIDDFAKKENLSLETKEHLKQIILLGIQKRKLQSKLNRRLDNFCRHADVLLDSLFITNNNPIDAVSNIYKKDLFYVKNTRKTVTHNI